MAERVPRRTVLKGIFEGAVLLGAPALVGDVPRRPNPRTQVPEAVAPVPQLNVETNALPVQYDYDLRVPLTDAFTGGDGGFSCKLPDGRTIIVYSDTVKGGIEQPDAQGRLPRKLGGYLVNNTAIIIDEEKGIYSVLSGPKAEDQRDIMGTRMIDTAWIVPPQGEEEEAIREKFGSASYYWQQTPTVANGKLYVSMSREVRSMQQATAIAGTTIGIDIARYDLSEEFPVLEAITPLPRHEDPEHTRGISWGAGIVDDAEGQFTYVYGSKRQRNESKELYVARVPVGQLDHLGSWQFWQGKDWVQGSFKESESQAAAILASDQGLSAGFSVDLVDNKVVLVNKDTEILTDKIAAFIADTFTGPWEKHEIYTVPDHNKGPHAPDPKHGLVVTYSASLHPEAVNPSRPGQMLITYCKNVIRPFDNPHANPHAAHAADAELSRTESVWIPKGDLLRSDLLTIK